MKQEERELIEKIIVLSQSKRDGKLYKFVRLLYNDSEKNSTEYQKEVEETLRSNSENEEEFQSILNKLYESVKSVEWSKGEIETLLSTKKMYEDERRQK